MDNIFAVRLLGSVAIIISSSFILFDIPPLSVFGLIAGTFLGGLLVWEREDEEELQTQAQ